MGSNEDKRRQHRVPVELWIEVQSGGELYFQRATNLSVGGAYFTQTFPLPVGTRVELRFQLPGAVTDISCLGEIVNAADLGMGVRFLDLSDGDRAAVQALIENHVTSR